jgi:glycine/D-amino acid oxidase-like deaminating enzyme
LFKDTNRPKLAVVGAGFYGLSTALSALESNWDVSIFESRSGSMKAASEFNQARVHGGYHYPRSLITAMRSRNLYRTFINDYSSAVTENSLATYLIAKNSKVSTDQFKRMAKVIGAPLRPIQSKVRDLIDWNSIDSGFSVEEAVFDASILRDLLTEKVYSLGGEIFFDAKIYSIEEDIDFVRVNLQNEINDPTYDAVAICTYGFTKGFSEELGFTAEVEAEVCEMVVVELPKDLLHLSITVMDGPFWSVTPFPLRGGHILSSVRHTPHKRFSEPESANTYLSRHVELKSRGALMLLDAAKHVPMMRDLQITDSLWGVKVIPRKRDHSDARPIMVKKSKRVISILGSKLDNVYDAQNEVTNFLKALRG